MRLTEEVANLSSAIDHIGDRTKRGERIMKIVACVVALTLALCVVVALESSRLRQVQAREEQTRQAALCPLFSLIVGSYRPESRRPGLSREQYDAAFDQMRAALDELDCSNVLVPPPGG